MEDYKSKLNNMKKENLELNKNNMLINENNQKLKTNITIIQNLLYDIMTDLLNLFYAKKIRRKNNSEKNQIIMKIASDAHIIYTLFKERNELLEILLENTEAELGSDNEEHDDVIKKVYHSDSESDKEKDKNAQDIENLIDNEEDDSFDQNEKYFDDMLEKDHDEILKVIEGPKKRIIKETPKKIMTKMIKKKKKKKLKKIKKIKKKIKKKKKRKKKTKRKKKRRKKKKKKKKK